MPREYETFKGTCLCHTRSSAAPKVTETCEVKNRYVSRTEYPLLGSNLHKEIKK
jgi:hypothetical protein